MATERHYLTGLDLRGRRVLLVGGGGVAARRLPRLLAAGAKVEVISPEVTPAVQAMAESGEIVWRPRRYRDGDLAEAWYVISAATEAGTNEAVVAEAEARRVFCVRADAGELGSAVTPAIGTRGGMVLGVLAAGDHRRSAAVRDAALGALRVGRLDEAAEPEPAGVALVGGGPGDPELITVAGARLLARADAVVTDRLAPRELLDELPPGVRVVDVAKIPYGRSTSQDAINRELVSRAAAGQFVVRLKGGDPLVFGRGFEEVLACTEAGVGVRVVPGVTSAFAAPALAGVPVTHRGVAHEVVVVSGHVPPGDASSLVDWKAIAALRGTVVLMMAVGRLGEFARVLRDGGRPAESPVAVVADGSMPSQRAVRSTLARVEDDVAACGIRPPAIIVVGPVAALGDPAPPIAGGT
jgi:uroporphyrin-III C-methyltransferase/precorrin-2 dehydrogenase/sirohydrochlorin ferrochelatase